MDEGALSYDQLRQLDQAALDRILQDAAPEPPEVRARRSIAQQNLRNGLDCGAFVLGPWMKIELRK